MMRPPAFKDNRPIRPRGIVAEANAEDAFTEMDHRFLEASPDCVKVIDLDGRVSYINGNGCRLLDIEDHTQIAGQPWTGMFPDTERAAVSQAAAEAFGGRTSRFSAYCPTRGNRPKWWDIVVSPVRQKDGSVGSLLAVSRDVTHQMSIEQTLRTSEKHFRALANNIAQLAWMADPSGAIFWYNQRWFDYTGTTYNEMAGWGWREVHHPDHLDRVVEKFKDCLESGEEWEDVFPLRGADGSYRWFLSRAMPLRDAAGNIELWCGTNTDVTEQRNQSQRLRQLVRIIDLSHEAILVWDMQDGIVIWNRGCEELYGFDKATATGAASHELLQTKFPFPVEEFERMLVAEGSWSGEILQVAHDGSEVWVDTRQELIRIGGRRLVLETNRDITDRRRADEIRNLLLGELNHRVKNTMAIIQSIAAQTARCSRDTETFVASFNGRLQSLASAHNVLTDSHWAGASLKQLVQSQLAIIGGLDDRIIIEGDDVFLPPQTALQFTLILYELATNAVKHGALSNESGRISISWDLIGGDTTLLGFFWRESGGPAVRAPLRRGFGLTLIERSGKLPKLKTSIAFEPQGLVAVLTAELAQPVHESTGELFNPGKKLMSLRQTPARAEGPLVRQRILIVGRQPSDAMQIEDMMYEAGYVTIGPVTSLTEMRRKLDFVLCDLAIVDADGARDEVGPILRELAQRVIPSILIGSVRHLAEMEGLHETVERLAKPLQPQALIGAVARAAARRGSEAGAPSASA